MGDDAQRPLRADEQITQRVARHVLDAFVAGPKHLAVGQDDFQPHDVIAGDAVFQSAQAAGVFRHVAAEGGDFHRAWIGRVEQAGCGRRVGNGLRGRARLDPEREVGAVEFEDPVHLHKAKHHAVRAGHAAAAQARAGATRDDGGFGLVRQLQDGGHLLGGLREDHSAGHLPQGGGAVERIRDQVLGLRENVFVAEQTTKFGEDGIAQGHRFGAEDVSAAQTGQARDP